MIITSLSSAHISLPSVLVLGRRCKHRECISSFGGLVSVFLDTTQRSINAGLIPCPKSQWVLFVSETISHSMSLIARTSYWMTFTPRIPSWHPPLPLPTPSPYLTHRPWCPPQTLPSRVSLWMWERKPRLLRLHRANHICRDHIRRVGL